MVYAPELLVVTLRVAPVPTDFVVTVAPLTTAPLGSVTVPVIVPVSLCPNTYTEQRARTLRKHSNFVIAFMSCSLRRRFVAECTSANAAPNADFARSATYKPAARTHYGFIKLCVAARLFSIATKDNRALFESSWQTKP